MSVSANRFAFLQRTQHKKGLAQTLVEAADMVFPIPDQDVSPERAAEILGVSRPVIYQRMDAGKLPYRQVGTHRRVRMSDLLILKESEDRRRSFAAALSADTEELEEHDAQLGQGNSGVASKGMSR